MFLNDYFRKHTKKPHAMVYSLHCIDHKKHQKVNKTELFRIFRLHYSRQSHADPRYTNRGDVNVIVITGD